MEVPVIFFLCFFFETVLSKRAKSPQPISFPEKSLKNPSVKELSQQPSV
jgi:hypothetical protein